MTFQGRELGVGSLYVLLVFFSESVFVFALSVIAGTACCF